MTYIVWLSTAYQGWCVYRELPKGLTAYISGPYTSEYEAKLEADRLNEIHQ